MCSKSVHERKANVYVGSWHLVNHIRASNSKSVTIMITIRITVGVYKQQYVGVSGNHNGIRVTSDRVTAYLSFPNSHGGLHTRSEKLQSGQARYMTVCMY